MQGNKHNRGRFAPKGGDMAAEVEAPDEKREALVGADRRPDSASPQDGRRGAASRRAGGRRRKLAVLAAAGLVLLLAVAAGIAAALSAYPPSELGSDQGTARATGAAAVVADAVDRMAVASAEVVSSVAETAQSAGGESALALEDAVTQAALDAERATLDLASLDLNAIPSTEDPTCFSLTSAEVPALSAESQAAVTEALAQVRAMGEGGFVLIDCASGTGIAAGADTAVYGASTYKGPYAAYVCEALVDGGVITLDSACPVTPGLNYESTFGLDASSYPVRDLLQALVTNSDNDAFRVLRGAYDRRGYDTWMQQFGDQALARGSLFYPTYCARTSVKLWAHIYEYLESGSSTAAWLSELFENTHVSFLRAGVERAGVDATVRNKAGWYVDADEPQYNCTSDAGIVQVGGTTYLVSIMTAMPYSDAAAEAYEDLAAALFDPGVLLALR